MTASSCAALPVCSPFPADKQDPHTRYFPQVQQESCFVLISPADFGSGEQSSELSKSALALSDWERRVGIAQGYQTAPSCQTFPARAQRCGGPRLKPCQIRGALVSHDGQYCLSWWKRAAFQDRQLAQSFPKLGGP